MKSAFLVLALASAGVVALQHGGAEPSTSGRSASTSGVSAIRDAPLGKDFLEIVPKSSQQSAFDDTAPSKASSTLVLHKLSAGRSLSQHAQAGVHTAAQLLLEENHAETHSIRVAHDGPRVYITASGLSDAATGKPHSAQLNAALAHVHKYATSCDVQHVRSAPASVASFLQHDTVAQLLCAKGSPAVSSSLLLGYAFAERDMDHDEARRSLQAVAQDAVVHSRDLHPPVFSNPLLAYARKTKAVHTVQTDTGFRSRYRLAVAKAHPAFGNFSLAYDVELDERTVILDDEHDVMSVKCDERGVQVLALHPLPRLHTGAFVQGSAEWGCVQHASWGPESQRDAGDAAVASAFVLAVQGVTRSVHSSGSITYALRVKAVPMYAAARQWHYAVEVHPPSAEQLAKHRDRRLDLACNVPPTVAGTIEGEGLVNADCQDNNLFGEWSFNYDASNQAAATPKLYPVQGLTSLYFDNTYAYFNTYLRLQLITYVDIASVTAGLRRFEVTIGGDAGLNVELDAGGSLSSSGNSWTDLTQPESIGSITLYAGALPVHVSAELSLASRVKSTLGEVQATAGVSASASVALGVKYENMLTDGGDCYCIGGCTSGGEYYDWCNVNPGCSSGTKHDGEDISWAKCGSFQAQTVSEGLGWNPVDTETWSFQVTPPTVTSATLGASGSDVELQLGAKTTMYLYGTIPLVAIPYTGVKLNFFDSADAGSPAAPCASGYSEGAVQIQTGLMQLDISVGDIAIDLSAVSSLLPVIHLEQGFQLASIHIQSYAPSQKDPVCVAPASSGDGAPGGGNTGTEGGAGTGGVGGGGTPGNNYGGGGGSSDSYGYGGAENQEMGAAAASSTKGTSTTDPLLVGIGSFAGGVALTALVAAAVMLVRRRRSRLDGAASAGGRREEGGQGGAASEVINPLPA